MAEPIKTAEELTDWLFAEALGPMSLNGHVRSAVLAKVEESLKGARLDAFGEAVQAIQLAQEETRRTGKQGRSARNAEMRRREAIYTGGMDAARAAVEKLRSPNGTNETEAQS